ncbi:MULTISPECIES: TonB-dependent hemoglobin/transferrin/lactoferrin family receptor [unclassified Ensifer]|uniref:TonB-dependent hemoglobin/transferrin/lactoferrin family receptor n=1 Tax=unclassified Ensifer TaxID=2633371 RepID=UPI000DD9E1F8|nr:MULTISPECIES: TonB-dependent hemoglobin/transferrin/lactoferrin family receptor [unclassified Ensifer]MBD9495586.1 TonB-dependent hemoglobin/transferrin/lactoferrin family receptor [Ensifer sp. ENS01]MBD9523662.1 TonB-dependent hemoglobin/transferrin/lactoferrin family receptor [Ensifer sp. ENS02]
MLTRHRRLALLACAAVTFVPPISQAFAQSTKPATAAEAGTNTTVLQKIVAKGNRVTTAPKGSIADTPLASEIDEKTLEEKQVTDLDDLGRSVDAGINSSKQDSGINIRGLSGPRIVTTIDGVPIPFLSNSSRQSPFQSINANGGGDTFDFNSLSALDVVRGADSSRGGSGMLGGAIVLRTLEPEDLISDGKDWGALFRTIYDSEDDSITGSAAAARRFGDTSVLFQGSYRKGHERENEGTVGGTGATRTEANPIDFDQSNLLFKLRHELEGGHRIGFTAESFRRDGDADLMSEQGLRRSYKIGDYNGFEDRSRKRVSLDYDFEALSSDDLFSFARATLYWQELERSSGSNGRTTANVAYGRDNSISNESFGFSGSAGKDFEAGGFDHSVLFKLDVQRSDWNQYTWALCPTPTSCPSLNNQSEIPTVKSTTIGAVLEDRISMGDSAFALTPGVRFDWFDYQPEANAGFQSNPGSPIFGGLKDRDGARLSPKLLATYDATPDTQLFAQWSMAYRAPTVDELYSRFYNPFGRYAQLGNPDLKPETANGFEIGANFDTGGIVGRVAAFHNIYDNFIETTTNVVGGITEFRYENVQKARISGIELSALKTFDNGFNIHGSIAYAYGKNEDTDKRLRSVAPFKAILGAGYSQETFGVDLSTTLSAAMPNDDVATTFDAPGYGIVDFTGWWTPEEFKGLRVQAGVYNIFDKKYFNALGLRDLNLGAASSQPRDFYSEPGRTFKISLTQRF